MKQLCRIEARILSFLVVIVFAVVGDFGQALPKSIESKAFRMAKGTYEGQYIDKAAFAGVNLPAETKLPKGKGTAVVNVQVPQAAPFPPADHFHFFKITRAVVRQGGKLVKMKGVLQKVVGGPVGGAGILKVNVNLKPKKPKLKKSKMTGPGVFGGVGGDLTGKKK